MSEVFYTEIMVDILQFETMMQQDDMKNYFKQKLAFELAHKLIETNRATFTYTTLHDRDAIRLRAKVEL
jgi:hypothetical protein